MRPCLRSLIIELQAMKPVMGRLDPPLWMILDASTSLSKAMTTVDPKDRPSILNFQQCLRFRVTSADSSRPSTGSKLSHHLMGHARIPTLSCRTLYLVARGRQDRVQVMVSSSLGGIRSKVFEEGSGASSSRF